MLIHHHEQENRALELGLARLFGILGLNFVDDAGGGNAAANLVSSAAQSTARARSKTWSRTRSDSAAASAAHASARAKSVGGKSGLRQRIAQLVRIQLGDVGVRLHDERGIHNQFRILHMTDHGRDELLGSEV